MPRKVSSWKNSVWLCAVILWIVDRLPQSKQSKVCLPLAVLPLRLVLKLPQLGHCLGKVSSRYCACSVKWRSQVLQNITCLPWEKPRRVALAPHLGHWIGLLLCRGIKQSKRTTLVFYHSKKKNLINIKKKHRTKRHGIFLSVEFESWF